MLVVMQLKMSPEMGDRVRRLLDNLLKEHEGQILSPENREKNGRMLNFNNLLRVLIEEGLDRLEERTLATLLRVIETGMTRGRPTKDA